MSRVRFYRDGVRFGDVGVRWNAGLCAPERRTHVFLFSLASHPDVNRVRFAVQVWRAFVWIEVLP